MTEHTVKGVALTGALVFARQLPGGVDAFAELLPEGTREIAGGPIVASSWYSIDHLLAMLGAIAELEGHTTLEAVAERQSRLAARSDVEGLYRAMLAAAEPEEMAERLPRAFNRYFRPTQATLKRVVPPAFEVELAPIPAPLESFYRATNEGFVTGALEAAGARGVSFEWRPPARDGDALRLTFVARWA